MLNIFKKRFIDDNKFQLVKQKQISYLPQLLATLEKHGVKLGSKNPLKFYFYTDSEKKALELKKVLISLGNEIENVGKNTRGEYSIIGLTNPTEVNLEELQVWVKKMLDLGFEKDCEFDGFDVSVSK